MWLLLLLLVGCCDWHCVWQNFSSIVIHFFCKAFQAQDCVWSYHCADQGTSARHTNMQISCQSPLFRIIYTHAYYLVMFVNHKIAICLAMCNGLGDSIYAYNVSCIDP